VHIFSIKENNNKINEELCCRLAVFLLEFVDNVHPLAVYLKRTNKVLCLLLTWYWVGWEMRNATDSLGGLRILFMVPTADQFRESCCKA